MDAATRLAQLRAADRSPAGRGPLLTAWREAVAAGELAPDALGDVALLLLETLGEADGSLDMVAAGLLAEYGAPRHIEPLRALRPTLRPRVALRDWRLEVGRALELMVARRDGVCRCAVDARHGAPFSSDRYRVEAESDDVANYTTSATIRCAACARRWQVRTEHGYHYPIFRWRGQ